MPETAGHGLKRGTPPASRKAWWLAGYMVGATVLAIVGWHAFGTSRRNPHGNPARRALKELCIGTINLKTNEGRDRDLPLAARLTGQTQAGMNQFADQDADFQAAGVKAGDALFILSGQCRGAREVAGVGPKALTLKGPAFAGAEAALAYFIRRADGRVWPEIDIARELDPANPGWTGVYAPRVNKRRLRYFTAPKGRISNGQLVDPWGQPFVYTIQLAGDKIVEKIVCSGPDRKPGTPDDLEEVIAELPFGGG